MRSAESDASDVDGCRSSARYLDRVLKNNILKYEYLGSTGTLVETKIWGIGIWTYCVFCWWDPVWRILDGRSGILQKRYSQVHPECHQAKSTVDVHNQQTGKMYTGPGEPEKLSGHQSSSISL